MSILLESDFVAMSFCVVFVKFAFSLVSRGFVRPVAERLVFRQTAHANPDGFLLRFDFKRSVVRFYDSAHMDLLMMSELQ
jgi:hypothetical protein